MVGAGCTGVDLGVWRWFGSTPAGVELGAAGCLPESGFGAAAKLVQILCRENNFRVTGCFRDLRIALFSPRML